MPPRSGFRWSLVVLLLLTAAATMPLLRRSAAVPALTVYCAHDAIFADDILQRFEQQTGIPVHVVYDEEASKSLGLTNRLIAEREHPQCDVFWNNQTLGTVRLKQAGVLAPWRGSGFERIPAAFRDADGYWTGFAARMRVIIVNTDLMPATDAAVSELLQSASLEKMAIAVPLYGTTLTHYSVLAARDGLDGLQQWHRSLHARGIREARGNGAVKDLVADGACAAGFTDTDDVFVALRQQKPVRMVPVRLEGGETIVIANSVALIRGCPHPEAAGKLIDFLLSAETELLLARSTAHQIPLGDVDWSQVPPEVRELADWARQGVSMDAAAEQTDAVLNWLSAEYLGQ